MRKARSTVPENERVFDSEDNFLEASDEIKKNSLAFVVVHNETNKKHFVWAATKSVAIGLVARKMNAFSCISFNKSKKFNNLNLDAKDVRLLLSTLSPEVLEEVKQGLSLIVCPFCKTECKSRAGLTLHKKMLHKEEYEKEINAGLN